MTASPFPIFFTARFNDNSGTLRTLIIIIFLVFMVTYVSAQFVGGGKAFFTNFGLNQTWGIILTAAIHMGGWNEVSKQVLQVDQGFFNPFALSLGVFAGFLGIGLGSPGNPHILVRYMSIKDPSQFRWTAMVGTIWNILMACGALFNGIISRAYFPEADMLPDGDAENVYLSLAGALFHPVLVGLLLASIFAAIMSTADSQLLVAASSVVRDLYERILHKDRSIPQKQLTLLSRLCILFLVIVAIFLGIVIEDLVFWFVLFAWAGLGAAIGPTSILALFWKRTTKAGVIAGLVGGTITVFIWKSVPALNGLIYELIPAFFIALAATFIVSLMTDQNRVGR